MVVSSLRTSLRELVLRCGASSGVAFRQLEAESSGLMIWVDSGITVTYLSWPLLLDVPWRLGRGSMDGKFVARRRAKPSSPLSRSRVVLSHGIRLQD
jgi:hypothetical protein